MSRFVCAVFVALASAIGTRTHAQSARVSFAEPVRLFGYASGVALEWSVYDDEAVAYYVVLRRSAGMERAIATVMPEREPEEPTTAYRYIDARLPNADTRFRLRAVFEDESYADSDWLDAGRATASRNRILSALDDESLALLHIRMQTDVDHDVTVRIRALNGGELDSYPRALVAGENVLEIDYRSWSTGYYTVEVDDAADVSEWLVHVDSERKTARTRQVPRTP